MIGLVFEISRPTERQGAPQLTFPRSEKKSSASQVDALPIDAMSGNPRGQVASLRDSPLTFTSAFI
jgi:hypothetical protein